MLNENRKKLRFSSGFCRFANGFFGGFSRVSRVFLAVFSRMSTFSTVFVFAKPGLKNSTMSFWVA